MDAGVEHCGEMTRAGVVAEATEPVAQPLPEGIGIEFEIVVLGCLVHGSGTAAFAGHAVHVRRTTDHDEIGGSDQT